MDMIKLTDETTGRRAPCVVRFHDQAAAEIDADALADWARRIRRARFVRSCLSASCPACVEGLALSTPSAFACGLYVSDADGIARAWVEDGSY